MNMRFFANLHVSENPSRVKHEHALQALESPGTRYTPSSMSETQVTRVHANNKSYTQVYSRLSTGAP